MTKHTETWSHWRAKLQEFCLFTFRDTRHKDMSYTQTFGIGEVTAAEFIRGGKSGRGHGFGWLRFWMFHCVPNFAWADGNLAELARQLANMVEHPFEVNPTHVPDHFCHPVVRCYSLNLAHQWLQDSVESSVMMPYSTVVSSGWCRGLATRPCVCGTSWTGSACTCSSGTWRPSDACSTTGASSCLAPTTTWSRCGIRRGRSVSTRSQVSENWEGSEHFQVVFSAGTIPTPRIVNQFVSAIFRKKNQFLV